MMNDNAILDAATSQKIFSSMNLASTPQKINAASGSRASAPFSTDTQPAQKSFGSFKNMKKNK
jgi:hypothetical protein